MFCSGSGGTRTHSIPGSKPKWSADCLPSRFVRCAQGGSRTHKRLGLSRAALPSWRTWARVVPDGVEPSLPGCEPGVVPLDHGTVSHCKWTHRELHSDFRRAEPTSSCWTMSPFAEAVGLELTGALAPPVFKTGPHPAGSLVHRVPGVGIEPTSSWFRARRHYQQQLPRDTAFASSGRRVRTSVS